jgi:predicted mannosyl-3-phosphoglycerate phosphatase (HAD superfamily)
VRRYPVATWCEFSTRLEERQLTLSVEARVWSVLDRGAALRGVSVERLLGDALNGAADVGWGLGTMGAAWAIAWVRRWLHV